LKRRGRFGNGATVDHQLLTRSSSPGSIAPAMRLEGWSQNMVQAAILRDASLCAPGRSLAPNTKPGTRILPRHCEELLRRSNPAFLSVATMDCFAQSSARSRARLARNDEP
jgi:hypothetical protein